jgi:hypothetical protein
MLAGFSTWAALSTNAAARQVDHDNAEQRAWQTARLELARAEAAQQSYLQQPRAQSRAAIMRASVALRISLRFIEQRADPTDAAFARQVAISFERYRTAIGRLLAAGATGDAARLSAIEAREVQPSFAALADKLAEGARDEGEQVAASLAALRGLGETLVVAAPVAFTVGLGLLIGCWLLLVGYQHRIKQQALSDALTGLPNRTCCATASARRSARPTGSWSPRRYC